MTAGHPGQQGLSTKRAKQLLAEFGPNELERSQSRGLVAVAFATLREPLFGLLIAGCAIYIAIGDLAEGVFLLAGALAAIGLVIFQEVRSERALSALRDLAQPSARVIRDGVEQEIDARSLVPGDRLILGEGQRIPADAQLSEGVVVRIDESALTGESAPVIKGAGPPTESRLVRAGTIVLSGAGPAIVEATGARTEFGAIGSSLANIREDITPLQKTARRLVGYLAVAALMFCAIVFGLYVWVRGDVLQAALASITAAISLLPEEFPVVLTVFLALGAWRLARHNVLVRRSAVVETLGAASLLCVDKTGTLTSNKMTLSRLWHEGQVSQPADPDLGAGARELLEVAALATVPGSDDPMDRSISAFATGASHSLAGDLVATWPIRPKRLAVIQLWARGDETSAAAKGAPETIIGLCRMGQAEARRLRSQAEALAAEGDRVLGVAAARLPQDFRGEPEAGVFEFCGFLAFSDPLREDVPEALQRGRSAGIGVVMITGDHPSTALQIARQAGIDTRNGVLTGDEMLKLDGPGLRERARNTRVYARITPDQKLRLVQTFRRMGHVVVMTGDGVNDGPALKAADVGVAMGQRGTDVARQSADIVLLDDSFASIVGGVRLGRRIFANLRKSLSYITAIHVPLAGLAVLPLLLGWPQFLYPMHVVLLELVIDPMCALVFEAEPSEKDSMRRPPRSPDEPLFGPRQIAMSALQGMLILCAVTLVYGWSLANGEDEQARGAAFLSLAIANVALAMASVYGGRGGAFDRRRLSMWIVVLAALVMIVASFTIPFIADILQIAPLAPTQFAAVTLVSVVAGGWFGLYQLLIGSFRGRREV